MSEPQMDDDTPPWVQDADPDKDYAAAVETWIGQPLQAELTIHPPSAEDAETTTDREPKRFVLVEPDDQETMQAIYQAIYAGDRLGVCRSVVAEPQLTDAVWTDRLTGYERAQLFAKVASWLHTEEVVDLDRLQQLVEQA